MQPDQDSAAFKPRKGLRNRVSKTTTLRHQHLYSVEVQVRDVSTGGFMAECPEPVRIGSYVSLDVPGVGPVHGQVRWQLGGRIGGMFLDPISLSRCEWTATPVDPAEEPAPAG